MKPILFNIEMVRAIMEGRKTVTRRVVKPQPPATSVVRKRGCAWDWSFWEDCDMGHMMKLPYHPGDILWVRETWNGDWCDHYIYKADGGSAKAAGYAAEPKWRPSIHMPREAARIFLKVTDVRVERLQEIDGLGSFDEGAVAPMPKGCLPPQKPDGYDGWSEEKRNDWLRSMARATYISKLEFQNRLIKAFRNIWDSTIKPKDLPTYGWVADPWVWVIEFERISKDEALGGGGDGN